MRDKLAFFRQILSLVLGVPGAVALALGLFGVIEAVRTGQHDARHGGALLFAGGVVVATIGLILIGLAILVRPRRGSVVTNRAA